MMYTWTDGTELYHHGILGQKWGVRNGPPYPIDAKRHSANEKKAGWRKSLNTDSRRRVSHKISLTDKQKKALIIGGLALATTALVIIGGNKLYKTGKIGPLITKGKIRADMSFGSLNQEPVINIAEIDEVASNTKFMEKSIEGIKAAVKGINPTKCKVNCVACSITNELRRRYGLELTAEYLDDFATVEDLMKVFPTAEFKSIKIHSKDELTRYNALTKKILRDYKEGSRGTMCFNVDLDKIDYGTSHSLSWEILNGKVIFSDGMAGSAFLAADQPNNLFSFFTESDIIIAKLSDSPVDFSKVGSFVKEFK